MPWRGSRALRAEALECRRWTSKKYADILVNLERKNTSTGLKKNKHFTARRWTASAFASTGKAGRLFWKIPGDGKTKPSVWGATAFRPQSREGAGTFASAYWAADPEFTNGYAAMLLRLWRWGKRRLDQEWQQKLCEASAFIEPALGRLFFSNLGTEPLSREAAIYTSWLQVRNLRKSYGKKTRPCGAVDLDVGPVEVFPCWRERRGETTSLECIRGIRSYDRRQRVRNAQDGIQLQSASLPAYIRGKRPSGFFAVKWNRTSRDRAMLAALGAEALADKQYREMSTGQKRRLHLALALTGNPTSCFWTNPRQVWTQRGASPSRMHPRTEGQGKDRPAVQPRYGRGGEPVRRHRHSLDGRSLLRAQRGTGGPPGHLLQRPDQNKPGNWRNLKWRTSKRSFRRSCGPVGRKTPPLSTYR